MRLLLTLWTLLLLPAGGALACRCVPRSFTDNLAQADQVCIGRVVRVSGYGGCYGLFEVRQRFKGVVPDTLTIRSEPTSCGITFEAGQAYVIFAHRGWVGRCDRSRGLVFSNDVGKLSYASRHSFADSLGRDDTPLLNSSEAFYFNSEFQSLRGTFSFQGRRVAFFDYNTPTRLSKQQYLRCWGGQDAGGQLLVLAPAEKLRAGGYDAIIVSWRKVKVSPSLRRRLVRRLGRTPVPAT